MAVQGHKERALMRRGLHVKEALQRRGNLNESAQLRRRLFETEEEEATLDDFCMGFYDNDGNCSLRDMIEAEPSVDLQQEIFDSLKTIYQYFRPQKNDNKTIFRSIVRTLLKNENPANSFILVANFLTNPPHEAEEITRRLLSFRNETFTNPEEVERYLTAVRHIEYSKYEESFNSENFGLKRGKISFGRDFFSDVLAVYNGKTTIRKVVEKRIREIVNVNPETLVGKADLDVKKPIYYMEKGKKKLLLPAGAQIEVKKKNHDEDSYFSEFYSIYKDSNLPAALEATGVEDTQRFLTIYNKIIDGIYVRLKNGGRDSGAGLKIIDTIMSGVDGIIFDKNLLILKKDIELYWSNKGQRGCNKDHRLTIRHRIKNSPVDAFVYDTTTHSNVLEMVEIPILNNELSLQECPLT